MRYCTLLVSFLVVGCGQKPQFSIEGFEPYYDTFVTNTNIRTDNLIIRFSDLSDVSNPLGETVGECQWGTTPTVTIDPYYWNTLFENSRQELMDHELGHCILNRQHRNDLLTNGQPASIMNQFTFAGFVLDANSTYYYHELVHGN